MQDVLERTSSGGANEVKERPAMHRVGTTKGKIENPRSLAERLIHRRLDLKLGQLEVAQQVRFYNDKQKKWATLSRSAYCMYETGTVTPDLAKIEEIAKALKCSPQWLAFGDGQIDQESKIEEVDWDPEAGDFTPRDVWNLSENWLQDSLGLKASDVTLCQAPVPTATLKPGYIAIVHKDEVPNASGSEYIFVEDGNLSAAYAMRIGKGGTVRLFDIDMRTSRDVQATDLKFLGRVVGNIAGR